MRKIDPQVSSRLLPFRQEVGAAEKPCTDCPGAVLVRDLSLRRPGPDPPPDPVDELPQRVPTSLDQRGAGGGNLALRCFQEAGDGAVASVRSVRGSRGWPGTGRTRGRRRGSSSGCDHPGERRRCGAGSGPRREPRCAACPAGRRGTGGPAHPSATTARASGSRDAQDGDATFCVCCCYQFLKAVEEGGPPGGR